jgi:hypothetical protein
MPKVDLLPILPQIPCVLKFPLSGQFIFEICTRLQVWHWPSFLSELSLRLPTRYDNTMSSPLNESCNLICWMCLIICKPKRSMCITSNPTPHSGHLAWESRHWNRILWLEVAIVLFSLLSDFGAYILEPFPSIYFSVPSFIIPCYLIHLRRLDWLSVGPESLLSSRHRGAHPRDKANGAWIWPLTPI